MEGTAQPGSQGPEQARVAHGTSGNKWVVLLVLGATLVGLTCLIVGLPLTWFLRNAYQVDKQKQWLLHEVDHETVRTAARGMLKDHSHVSPEGTFFMADDLALPQEIGSLRPTSVHVTSNEVTIEFGGGFQHYGLAAFSEGEDVSRRTEYAYTELSDGIWFYEEVE